MPAHGDARAWWMIDGMERLQRAQLRGETRDLTRDVPAGLAEAHAVRSSRSLTRSKPKRTPSSRVVLGGFFARPRCSRRTSCFERRARSRGWSCCRARCSVKRNGFRSWRRAEGPARVHESRQRGSDLCTFSRSPSAFRDELKGAGLEVTFRTFNGGHAIPPPVMMDLGEMLRKLWRLGVSEANTTTDDVALPTAQPLRRSRAGRSSRIACTTRATRSRSRKCGSARGLARSGSCSMRPTRRRSSHLVTARRNRPRRARRGDHAAEKSCARR